MDPRKLLEVLDIMINVEGIVRILKHDNIVVGLAYSGDDLNPTTIVRLDWRATRDLEICEGCETWHPIGCACESNECSKLERVECTRCDARILSAAAEKYGWEQGYYGDWYCAVHALSEFHP